jgi:hypothetical protein
MRRKLSKFALALSFWLALAFTPIAVFAQNEQNPPQGQNQYPPPQVQYQNPPPQGQYQYPPPQQYGVKQEDMKQKDINQDKNASIGGSIGYLRVVLDEMEDYPIGGFYFSFGADGFIPSASVVKLGAGISINYFTASVTDEYDVKLTLSNFYLDLSPTIRFGKEKIYADIKLGMSIPLSSEMTLEIPGYRTETEKINNTETDFQLSLVGRFNVIGLSIGKELKGGDGTIMLGASAFISITEQVEIVPEIVYLTGDGGNELHLGIGFNYFL